MSSDAPTTEGSGLPYISIVIPVRNEGRYIQRTLDQLLQQAYPANRYEIIVVDGRSDDDTREVVETVRNRSKNNIRLLDNGGRLSSCARNIGIKESVGDWVLIIDGHVHIPDAHLLRNCATIINKTGAEVLGRPQRLRPPGITPFQEAVAEFRESPLGHSKNSYVFSMEDGWVNPGSVGVMYTKAIFERFGEFDESLDAAEDYEFNSRLEAAGIRCYMSPSLEVFYYPRENIRGLFRQMRRYGLGQSQLARRRSTTRATGAWAPAMFVAVAIAFLLAAIVWPIALLYMLAGAAVYSIVVWWVCRRYCRTNGVRVLTMVFVALAVHAGLGVGIWDGLRRGRGR